MATRFENLTSQIDGVTDTFTLGKTFISGTVSLGYNGQLYPAGMNIVEELRPTNQIKLSFVPTTDTDTLLVIYNDDSDIILAASAVPPRTIL